MPPAARITDPTAHGGIVVLGFPTVIIGGMPASRITDMHTCPMVTGVIPHVGGPFVTGAFTVLTGYMPQSKVGDTLICVGPPDTLLMGCPTVQVGMAGGGGGAAAIMAGLALIAAGILYAMVDSNANYPRSELVNGEVVTQYSPSITIKGSPKYQATVISQLNTFLGSKVGKSWNSAYDKAGHHLTIQPIPAGEDACNSYASPTNDTNSKNGKGSDSTIDYNPTFAMNYNAADGTSHTDSTDAILGHEMIHSLHNAQGNNLQNNTEPAGFGNEEESQTIGVNGHDHDPMTENAYHDEQGTPRRTDHTMTGATYQDQNGNYYQRSWDASGNQVDTPVPAPQNAPPSQ